MKYLDKNGLTRLWSKIKGQFASKKEFSELQSKVATIENKIQHISATTSDMTIANVPVYHGTKDKQFVVTDEK